MKEKMKLSYTTVLICLMLTLTASTALTDSSFPSRYSSEDQCILLIQHAIGTIRSRMKGESKNGGDLYVGLLFAPYSFAGLTSSEAKEHENLRKDFQYIIDIAYATTPATEKDQIILYNKIVNEVKHGCYPK